MHHLAAHAQDLAARVGGELHTPILIALLDRAEEMLAPVLHPFDRPAQLARDGGHDDLLRIDHELRAEAAAHLGCDHAQLVLGWPSISAMA